MVYDKNGPDHLGGYVRPVSFRELIMILRNISWWVGRLMGHHKQDFKTFMLAQTLELTTEVGEYTENVMRYFALNPRKATIMNESEIIDEGCDVIITTMIMMRAISKADPMEHIQRRLQFVTNRMKNIDDLDKRE